MAAGAAEGAGDEDCHFPLVIGIPELRSIRSIYLYVHFYIRSTIIGLALIGQWSYDIMAAVNWLNFTSPYIRHVNLERTAPLTRSNQTQNTKHILYSNTSSSILHHV